MNADIPLLKVLINKSLLTDNKDKTGYEPGYAFAIQSYKGRALQFHVMMQSGAHFRHIPLHWLIHQEHATKNYPLQLLQLWDCFSYKPVVTVFDFLKDYSCDAILKDKTTVHSKYWFTIDWLPDSEERPGILGQPDQNKCCHVVLLETGQCAALPTNRLLFKDAFFIGKTPDATTHSYKTIDKTWKSEDDESWSVAGTDDTYY